MSYIFKISEIISNCRLKIGTDFKYMVYTCSFEKIIPAAVYAVQKDKSIKRTQIWVTH